MAAALLLVRLLSAASAGPALPVEARPAAVPPLRGPEAAGHLAQLSAPPPVQMAPSAPPQAAGAVWRAGFRSSCPLVHGLLAVNRHTLICSSFRGVCYLLGEWHPFERHDG